MLRKILATVAGLVAALIVIVLAQKLGQRVHPMPPGLDMKDKTAMAAWIAQLPTGALLVVLAGYAVASFAGGATAALIAGTVRPALAVGVGLMLMGIVNVLTVPHPIWLAVASLLVYVPLAWLGARGVLRR